MQMRITPTTTDAQKTVDAPIPHHREDMRRNKIHKSYVQAVEALAVRGRRMEGKQSLVSSYLFQAQIRKRARPCSMIFGIRIPYPPKRHWPTTEITREDGKPSGDIKKEIGKKNGRKNKQQKRETIYWAPSNPKPFRTGRRTGKYTGGSRKCGTATALRLLPGCRTPRLPFVWVCQVQGWVVVWLVGWLWWWWWVVGGGM